MQVDQPQLDRAPPEPNGAPAPADPGQSPDQSPGQSPSQGPGHSPDQRPGQSPGHGEACAGPGTAAVRQLLVGYAEILDLITARSAIVFLPHRCVPGRAGPCVIVPRVNRMAAVLAEAHVAARLDALVGRALRFRALDPRGPNPLDLNCLQDFRNSLSPVKRRSLTLWVVLLALAVAFPVAWITDYVRALAPKVILCSSWSSLGYLVKLKSPYSSASCNVHHAGASLVATLTRVAHLNLSPGGIIDTVLSVRASGVMVLLLLAVVWILSLCAVLLVFRSGFRLKRLAFSIRPHTPADHESLLRSGVGSGGLYAAERQAFAAVGLQTPREFPLDLAISAGLLVLPLTIAADLLIMATLRPPDLVRRAELAVIALGLIVLVLLRLLWLARIWRARAGTEVIEPRERWLPDGSTVLVTSGASGAVLLATGYIAWGIGLAGTSPGSVPAEVTLALALAPFLAWPLSTLWWYRLHREIGSCGRSVGLRLARTPILSVIPPVSLAVVSLSVLPGIADPAVSAVAGVGFLVGFFGFPVSVYRMGRDLELLRRRGTPNAARKARLTGLGATVMVVMPVAAILYFQLALNRVWRQVAEPAPPQITRRPGTVSPPGARPSPHWAMALTALILFFPTGVLAVVYAFRTRSKLRGDPAAARTFSSRVRTVFWLTIAIVVFSLIFVASRG
jgi:Interferon-induced transmembrane protein